MYAVIRTGGKQYRVKTGDVLEIEHLSVKDPNVSFKPVLVSTDDGRTLHGREAGDFTVGAKMLGDAKGDKVIVFKYKNKTGYRQLYSLIEITSIGDTKAQPEPQPELETPTEPEPQTTGEPEPAAEAAAGGA
jgi:large subunit ribosomal protein L21